MSVTFSTAFALRDNPFGPTQPLPGIPKFSVMMDLHTRPLQIHEEAKLAELYCRDAGPFGQLSDKFQAIIAAEGYDAVTHSRGLRRFIFFIMGYQGTGKTTLANVMLEWLKRCCPTDPTYPPWKIFHPWSLKRFASDEEQISALKDLGETILKDSAPEDYCGVVIDNVVGKAVLRALELFDTLTVDRFVFLFLITSDLEILKRPQNNSLHQIHEFRTSGMTSEEAVAFTRHRIALYRSAPPPDLTSCPLFPFDETDLREAVESKIIVDDPSKGIITLTQLGKILHKAIADRFVVLRANQPSFDISKIPQSQLKQYLVRVAPSYDIMVGRLS